MTNLSSVYDVNQNIRTGTYAGDGSQNRVIPHGLTGGTTPRAIILVNTTTANMGLCGGGQICFMTPAGPSTGGAVTAPDGTNFYVGTAATFIGNVAGNNYTWVVIGTL